MLFRVVYKVWMDLSSILSQFKRLTDGQMDGQTEFSSLDRVCILQHGKNCGSHRAVKRCGLLILIVINAKCLHVIFEHTVKEQSNCNLIIFMKEIHQYFTAVNVFNNVRRNRFQICSSRGAGKVHTVSHKHLPQTTTTSCSTKLFACLITCYIPSFRCHLTHHKDTIFENECIYIAITWSYHTPLRQKFHHSHVV